MKALVEKFKRPARQHRDQEEHRPVGRLLPRLPAAAQAGKGPDVGVMHLDQLATNAARRVIAPLDDAWPRPWGSRRATSRPSCGPRHLPGPAVRHPARRAHDRDVLQQGALREGRHRRAAHRRRGVRGRAEAPDKGVETPFWITNQWPAHLMFLSLVHQFGGSLDAGGRPEATYNSGRRGVTWSGEQVIDGGLQPQERRPSTPSTSRSRAARTPSPGTASGRSTTWRSPAVDSASPTCPHRDSRPRGPTRTTSSSAQAPTTRTERPRRPSSAGCPSTRSTGPSGHDPGAQHRTRGRRVHRLPGSRPPDQVGRPALPAAGPGLGDVQPPLRGRRQRGDPGQEVAQGRPRPARPAPRTAQGRADGPDQRWRPSRPSRPPPADAAGRGEPPGPGASEGVAWLFLAPYLVLFVAFVLAPILYGLWISLHQWDFLLPGKPFVGLENYVDLFDGVRRPSAVLELDAGHGDLHGCSACRCWSWSRWRWPW